MSAPAALGGEGNLSLDPGTPEASDAGSTRERQGPASMVCGDAHPVA